MQPNLHALTQPVCAIVHVATQPPHVYHAVTLDPAKISPSQQMIRLGDFPGDEYTGWQLIDNIRIIEILGAARFIKSERRIEVTPLEDDAKAA